MNNKKYMGILRLFKKKNFKLSLVVLSLVGLLASSGASFAKYRDENYGGGNAGTAKFGSWTINNAMDPINVPSDASKGWYAFKASFSISFTAGEVKRNYTLKIKDVDISSTADNFNSLAVSGALSFFLPASPGTIRTITRSTNSNGEVISTVQNSGVENILLSRSDISFTSNNIYMMYEETHGSNITGSPWRVHPVSDTIYDSTTDSIILTNDHVIEPNDADTHNYYLIYFIQIDPSKDLNDIKFIYSLDVKQVM